MTLSVRVYAQAAEAAVGHLRTKGGEREVDLIVERGGRVVAIEVKLGQIPSDADVIHLHWLSAQLGDDLADAIRVTSGPDAYRRPDGIGVVPAGLLGPEPDGTSTLRRTRPARRSSSASSASSRGRIASSR